MNDIRKASPTSHSYFSQRLRLHYLDWGNPSAPHVLLIHGVQDHCHSWDWVSHELCTDYHLIVPDLRGHGDSEWVKGSAYSHLDYIYDLVQLIHQEGLEPVNIIAHSMGGTIACLLAGIYPEKVSSLISVEGIGGIPGWYYENRHPQDVIRSWINNTRALAGRTPKRYDSQRDAFKRMQKSNPHLSEDQARHLSIHGSNRNEDGTYSWKFDNYTHSWGPYGLSFKDMTRLWEKIDCPTLLINARQGFDHRTGQNDTQKYFKHSELIDIDNAGHWLHHDQFDEFITATRNFLSQNAR